ncbi:unnamed protein product [Toxocara canis]|uniref:Cell division protein n=1 Tax=Toxocara canis TaxID=6265 RepID=A0A183U1R6_TOXCA|nr:unnamed protein product [Toxocara canis]
MLGVIGGSFLQRIEREVIIAVPAEILATKNDASNDEELGESPPTAERSEDNRSRTGSMKGKEQSNKDANHSARSKPVRANLFSIQS